MTWAVVISPLWRCPACGSPATVQAACAADVLVPDDPAAPGDLVICLGCEAICVTTDDGALRLFDADDCDDYPIDDVARVARAIEQLRASFTKRN